MGKPECLGKESRAESRKFRSVGKEPGGSKVPFPAVEPTSKSGKNVNRRGRGKKNMKKSRYLKILGSNANGIVSKKKSLINLINSEKPSIFMIQETKSNKAGQIKIPGFVIIERIRKNKAGGGILIGIDN